MRHRTAIGGRAWRAQRSAGHGDPRRTAHAPQARREHPDMARHLRISGIQARPHASSTMRRLPKRGHEERVETAGQHRWVGVLTHKLIALAL